MYPRDDDHYDAKDNQSLKLFRNPNNRAGVLRFANLRPATTSQVGLYPCSQCSSPVSGSPKKPRTQSKKITTVKACSRAGEMVESDAPNPVRSLSAWQDEIHPHPRWETLIFIGGRDRPTNWRSVGQQAVVEGNTNERGLTPFRAERCVYSVTA